MRGGRRGPVGQRDLGLRLGLGLDGVIVHRLARQHVVACWTVSNSTLSRANNFDIEFTIFQDGLEIRLEIRYKI